MRMAIKISSIRFHKNFSANGVVNAVQRGRFPGLPDAATGRGGRLRGALSSEIGKKKPYSGTAGLEGGHLHCLENWFRYINGTPKIAKFPRRLDAAGPMPLRVPYSFSCGTLPAGNCRLTPNWSLLFVGCDHPGGQREAVVRVWRARFAVAVVVAVLRSLLPGTLPNIQNGRHRDCHENR